MKKQVKKLKLAKETVTTLNLVSVTGGYSLTCGTNYTCPPEPNLSNKIPC